MKYAGLSEKAKKAARGEFANINVEDVEWWSGVYAAWKEKLSGLGYEKVEMCFSGFSSQGDGASIASGHIDLIKWLSVRKLTNKYRALYYCHQFECEVEARVIRRSHFYAHKMTVSADVSLWALSNRKAEEQGIKLQDAITEDVRKLSDELYADLEREYDSLTSDEAIENYILGNEEEFIENGLSIRMSALRERCLLAEYAR